MQPAPLRLAFATSESVTENYFYGGLANYTHRVAKALAGLGHDVHVVTLSEIDGAEFEHEGFHTLADALPRFLEQCPDAHVALVGRDGPTTLAPSLLDTFPNVCLEAMGLGRPVVGTAGTGFDELITEGETGALADGLVRAWAYPGLARMGEAARLKASEFLPERTVAALLEYYREVLRASGGKKAL